MKDVFEHIAPFLEPKTARDFERMKETIERVRGRLVFQVGAFQPRKLPLRPPL